MPGTSQDGPSRRDVLRLGGGALLATASLQGCGFFSTEPEGAGGGDSGGGGDAKEAPELAELVDAGELPPLAERLPSNPMVLEPPDGHGRYGGTWQNALLNPDDTPWLNRTIGYEPPMRFDPSGEEVIPNVFEDVEIGGDGREYTITLREGLKWSDGRPLTADDLTFAWEDVITNAELHEIMPEYLTSDGEPAIMERIDDFHVKLTFPEPNGLFLSRAAYNGHLIGFPKHYMEQFHLEYNPEVEQIADDEGHDDWMAYFWEKNDQWGNPERPTLHPWLVTDPLGEGNRVEFERNPYYFKTDPDGRQLPYIDRVVYELIPEPQVILLKAQSGELQMTTRHINTLGNKPVLGDTREEGGYDFITLENTVMNDMVIALNLDHQDPAQREVYQNREFRIALSHGINRGDLVSAVWQQAGVPWQAAPDDRSRFYDEEFALQFTEHDVDRANDLLDSIGLTDRDGDGFRLRPDGSRLVITISVAQPALIPLWQEAAAMVTQHWEQIGINARVDPLDRSLFYERKDWQANEHDTTVWTGDGGLKIEVLEPRWYFPFSGESNFATTWAQWYSSRGDQGSEPPEAARQQMELYWELVRTADEDQRDDLFREILTIAKEQFYVIGTVRVPDSYGIVANSMRNVPEPIPESAILNTPNLANPPLWFFEEGER